MTRINVLRTIAGSRDSVAWGKNANNISTNIWGNINALVFAGVLIVCSVTVGCSKEQPKPASSNTQIPVTQIPMPAPPAPVMQAESKPAAKKVVHKKPATVNYTDKTTGVTFEYPRRYAIETGDAATDLLASSPIPMNFVQPDGVALAAVELPESSFGNTDFSSAFFNVSVHKTLTADQCNEFAVPAPKVVEAKNVEPKKDGMKNDETKPAEAKPAETKTAEIKTDATSSASESKPNAAAPSTESLKPSDAQPATAQSQPGVEAKPTMTASAEPAIALPEPQGSKLLLGDMELRATEAVSGEGTRQSDSKYFHVYQNGACYEFAMNVTTVASADGLIKHVDRDKVFSRLEKILDTVKINPVAAPEVTAEAPATPATPESPAQ